jgi:hypothetical protein
MRVSGVGGAVPCACRQRREQEREQRGRGGGCSSQAPHDTKKKPGLISLESTRKLNRFRSRRMSPSGFLVEIVVTDIDGVALLRDQIFIAVSMSSPMIVRSSSRSATAAAGAATAAGVEVRLRGVLFDFRALVLRAALEAPRALVLRAAFLVDFRAALRAADLRPPALFAGALFLYAFSLFISPLFFFLLFP